MDETAWAVAKHCLNNGRIRDKRLSSHAASWHGMLCRLPINPAGFGLGCLQSRIRAADCRKSFIVTTLRPVQSRMDLPPQGHGPLSLLVIPGNNPAPRLRSKCDIHCGYFRRSESASSAHDREWPTPAICAANRVARWSGPYTRRPRLREGYAKPRH